MGRIYKPVTVSANGSEKLTVAFVDSGADETVISESLAKQIGVETEGHYRSYSASGQVIEGKFALVGLRIDETELTLEVGVTDTPFQSEYSDEEGVDVILGLDFLQDAKVKLDFAR